MEIKTYYIGSTKRTIHKRWAEHRSDVKYALQTTALAKKCLNDNLIPDWTKTLILTTPRTELKIRISEAMLIYLSRAYNCNDSSGLQLPFAWRDICNIIDLPNELQNLVNIFTNEENSM